MGFSVELVRPDDLVHLRVSGSNLVLDPSDPEHPVVVVEDTDRPAYLAVEFPAQTYAEHAYFEWDTVKIDPDPTMADGTTSKRPANQPKDANNEPLDPPGKPNPAPPPQGHTSVAQTARPSRLVFEVPPGTSIPYSLEGLLDWSGLGLSVSPIAAIDRDPSAEQIAQAPGIRPPHATETSIELPYRLVISPNGKVSWRHRTAPFTSRGRTELWHTRLVLGRGKNISELGPKSTASLRAIWSDDYTPDNRPTPAMADPDLGRTAMSANDRYQLVILTSAFHGWVQDKRIVLTVPGGLRLDAADATPIRIPITVTAPHDATPFEAEQLMLSPLGGWLRSRGNWNPPRPVPRSDFHDRIDLVDLLRRLDPPRRQRELDLRRRVVVGPGVQAAMAAAAAAAPAIPPLDLSEWVHAASLGRDHYVRIVYEGELWPFRHRASLVKVTERKFKEANGVVGAYLMQRMFIVVREPEKSFSGPGNPFKKVRLTTLVTPNIADPMTDLVALTERSFWVKVMTATGKVKFPFHGVATDGAGHQVDFTTPLLFVSLSDVGLKANREKVADAYNSTTVTYERDLTIPGQKVLFAPALAGTETTRLVTQTVNFVVDAAGNPPQMLKAGVKIEQVRELLGTDKPTTIAYLGTYLSGGFDPATGVFARVARLSPPAGSKVDTLASMVDDKLGLEFSADKAGGFATPNMAISALTQKLGPVAGTVAQAVTGTFEPASFFPAKTASLFGTFDLMELLATGALADKAPTMVTERIGTTVVTKLHWDTTVEPTVVPKGGDIAAFAPSGLTRLKVDGEVRKPVNPAEPPTATFHGTLNDFEVSILRSVFVKFVEFSFHTSTGKKTDVTVKLDPAKPVRFDGDLKFVEEIRNAIPPDLFGKGPSLDISPTGIRAGFSFALPPLAVGVFALKDVSLGAALTLPFLDGKPVFDFNVSERAHPFLLTVSLFAGGGFFHLQLDTAGMKSLEVALEFGAAAAIDIGVASGEVHIMAGIYFKLERKEGKTNLSAVLSGYLRMGGSLSVLGLITVSVEFNLSFTYDEGNDKAFGRATLTVQVKVACISKSVELTVERGFGGSTDPTFGQLVTGPNLWSEYAEAFA